MSPPPIPILTVLHVGRDALLGGSCGWLHIPKDGYLNVMWLTKKECYRVTYDVTAGHPLNDAYAAFNAVTFEQLKALA